MSDILKVRQDDRLRAAAFLQEALGLDADPATLEPELSVIKVDPFAHVYTIELESSVGDAAFLIYQYRLAAPAPGGKRGSDIFKADLETLELAAERDTPGPRILAHANADPEGYILATTPATYRALMGQPAVNDATSALSDLPVGVDSSKARSESADELLRLLKLANDQAKNWFAAVRSEGRSFGDAGDIPFSQEETALALFLIDESSIQDLLRLLAVMVDAAKRQGT